MGVDKHVRSVIGNSFFSEKLAASIVITLFEKSHTLFFFLCIFVSLINSRLVSFYFQYSLQFSSNSLLFAAAVNSKLQRINEIRWKPPNAQLKLTVSSAFKL